MPRSTNMPRNAARVALERPPSLAPMQLMVLGSGGSAAVPDISCVTDPHRGCACCVSALDGTKAGSFNIRGNTGAILRIPQVDGKEKTILIDCGKTFREQALKLFPKKGLRRIDACILTHHHADAIDGLDDLRAWTFKDAIERTIPVHCTRTTYDFIKKGFAYLMDKKAASGGGAVPTFDWIIFDEHQPVTICGVRITPLPVHHGQYFTTPPSPLISLAFLINSSVLYCSDVSYIPESTWQRIGEEVSLPDSDGNPSLAYPPLPNLQALVIDCSSLRLSESHFGLPQAIATARRLGACRTYLTDIPHATSHACWLHFCKEFETGRIAKENMPGVNVVNMEDPPLWRVWAEVESQAPYAHVYDGFDPLDEDYNVFTERALESVEAWAGGVLPPCWVRPLADGMSISWHEGDSLDWDHERVWDDLYH